LYCSHGLYKIAGDIECTAETFSIDENGLHMYSVQDSRSKHEPFDRARKDDK